MVVYVEDVSGVDAVLFLLFVYLVFCYRRGRVLYRFYGLGYFRRGF